MKTVYIVLIVLGSLFLLFIVPVLIGISWVVTRNVIGEGQSQIIGENHANDCLAVEVRPMKVMNPSTGVYEITIKRSAGGDTIGGVKLVLQEETENVNYIHDVPGNINPLETKSVLVSGVDFEANKIEILAYFLDDSGNEQLCSLSGSLSF